jgi:glutamine amidotransferase
VGVTNRVTIVDYGIGNLGSIANMLKRIGVLSEFATTPKGVLSASSLILPGVGAFDKGMDNLRSAGLIDALSDKVMGQKTPILGLCLGMQLFAESSEEGERPGLGWIKGRCVRFHSTAEAPIKVPHMGWNHLDVVNKNPLVENLGDNQRFYFANGFYVDGVPSQDVVATATHGKAFPAVVARTNVMGVQFHPEKSHSFGARLLRNFAEISVS